MTEALERSGKMRASFGRVNRERFPKLSLTSVLINSVSTSTDSIALITPDPQHARFCCGLQPHASPDVDYQLRSMQTYIYYVAEKVPGALEMQRFAHPIHVGLVTAENHVDAYTSVLENLRPTFADAPQPLEVRFEVVMPPRAGNGVWRHGKPIDTDITFGDED
jgi:hypothetical protein